jgi:hypothetical protein
MEREIKRAPSWEKVQHGISDARTEERKQELRRVSGNSRGERGKTHRESTSPERGRSGRQGRQASFVVTSEY